MKLSLNCTNCSFGVVEPQNNMSTSISEFRAWERESFTPHVPVLAGLNMTRGNYLLQVPKDSASKLSACSASVFANLLTFANGRVGSYPEPRPGDVPTHWHPEQG